MSQNYFISNMIPLQKGISEITNISVPINVVSFQQIPIQMNPYLRTQEIYWQDFSGFCTNFMCQPVTNSILPMNLNEQKENVVFVSPEFVQTPQSHKIQMNLTPNSVIENVSTTNVSKSNEASFNFKK